MLPPASLVRAAEPRGWPRPGSLCACVCLLFVLFSAAHTVLLTSCLVLLCRVCLLRLQTPKGGRLELQEGNPSVLGLMNVSQ